MAVMIEEKITITLEDGTKVELSDFEAEAIYKTLKKRFEKETTWVPYPVEIPYYPPYIHRYDRWDTWPITYTTANTEVTDNE